MGYQIGNVLKGLFSKLNTDATLSALITKIYVDKAPKNATYPYLVIGNNNTVESTMNTFGKKGKETRFSILVYDTSRSPIDIIAIAERVDTLLDWKSDLTISGNTHIKTAIQSSHQGYDINTSDEFEARFVILEYSIMTEES